MLTRSPAARRLLLCLGAVAGLIALGVIVTVGIGWRHAPELVAREMAKVERPLRAQDLPPGYLDALLRVEDPHFSTHRGVDLTTAGAGMTTITQGLAKFLYFDDFKPGLAKVPQSLFAVGLDARMSKDEILQLFLNRVYLGTYAGRGVHGFEEAARVYYGRSAVELERAQWLALVAMCVGPDSFNVVTEPERNRQRVARIERLLAGRCRPEGWRDVHYNHCDG